jgi:hypothetical protein
MAEEQVPYVPYFPEERGSSKKRYFEIGIVVVLLAVLAIIVLLKTNVLTNIPVIGPLFGGNINVLVVGQDYDTIKMIEDMRKLAPVNPMYVNTSDLENILTEKFFKKYNVIVLTEKASELPDIALQNLRKYLDSGGSLIFYGTAGTRVTGDPQSSGWAIIGNIPVVCSDLGKCKENLVPVNPEQTYLLAKDPEHPIMKGTFVGKIKLCPEGGCGVTNVVSVSTTDGNVVAVLGVEGEDITLNGIVEKTTLMGGKVIYFSYNPKYTPTLFKNAVLYAGGM